MPALTSEWCWHGRGLGGLCPARAFSVTRQVHQDWRPGVRRAFCCWASARSPSTFFPCDGLSRWPGSPAETRGSESSGCPLIFGGEGEGLEGSPRPPLPASCLPSACSSPAPVLVLERRLQSLLWGFLNWGCSPARVHAPGWPCLTPVLRTPPTCSVPPSRSLSPGWRRPL